MVDLSGIDFAMRSVIKAPGFLERQTMAEYVEEGKIRGMCRDLPMELPSSLVPKKTEIHWELFSGNRLVAVRWIASETLKLRDTDSGYVNPSTCLLLTQPEDTCRHFAVWISPNPAAAIWLVPQYRIVDAVWYVNHEGSQISGPISDLADGLWWCCNEIVKTGSIERFSKDACLARIAALKKLTEGNKAGSSPAEKEAASLYARWKFMRSSECMPIPRIDAYS